jgi:hypothetical protein
MPTDHLLDTNILVHLIRNKSLGQRIQTQYNLRALLSRAA